MGFLIEVRGDCKGGKRASGLRNPWTRDTSVVSSAGCQDMAGFIEALALPSGLCHRAVPVLEVISLGVTLCH